MVFPFLIYFSIKVALSLSTINGQNSDYEEDDACLLWLNKHAFNNTENHVGQYNPLYMDTFIKFDDFSQLKDNSCKRVKYSVKKVIKLYAEKRVLLPSNLDIQKVLRMFYVETNGLILIQNIQGFNHQLDKNRTISLPSNLSPYVMVFTDVDFAFYFNQTLINEAMCNSNISYYFHEHTPINYFSSIKTLLFNERIFYSSKVCPYAFMNTKLAMLTLSQITNSFIFKNRLEFIDVNSTSSDDLNIKNLKKFDVNIFFEDLTLKIVNRNVFQNIKILIVHGILLQMQPNLLDYFQNLSVVTLHLDNLKSFIHSNGISWLNYLNKNVSYRTLSRKNIDIRQSSVIQFQDSVSIFNNDYYYHDEDLCLFKDFPHKQLIYPSIISAKQKECTCTIVWLVKYSYLYLNLDFSNYEADLANNYQIGDDSGFETVRHCFSNRKLFTEKMTQCNLEENFKKVFLFYL
jgi:hypothetical protein